MKFNNGGWLMKEGAACFPASQVYYVKKDEKKVVITAPSTPISNRGMTLGGVNLTIEVTAPLPDTLRVRTSHYLGVQKKAPEFELNLQELPLEVKEDERILSIRNGSLTLEIEKENGNMTYYRPVDGTARASRTEMSRTETSSVEASRAEMSRTETGSGAGEAGENTAKRERITGSGFRDLAYIKTDWKGFAYDDGGLHDTYMREQLSLSVGELIYGLGERFSPFTKNGQSVVIWNEDGGTSTEQSYKNIPFYLSNKGYGVFVNHPEKVEFEVATECVTKVAFSVPGESLDFFLFNGPTMKEVLTRYTDLTGKPALPAPWTFGLWLSTSFTTNYDENTVNEFVDGMAERDIPLNVFHFDCFWMKEFAWTDFTWDSRVFPDPKGMLARLKEKGLKICVWINSYIGQESALFEEGVKNGYFLKRPNGDVWQWDMWQPGMAIVDFTNPAACKWYQDKLEELLDMGVDCFKTDFGERIPTDVVYYNGADPVKMHNYYTYLYNKTVYDLLVRKKGKEDAVVFARSATAGGQKFPVHWGGDCSANYESMSESLRGGLSLAMSGFGFWSHDISGFEDTASPDVYKRWSAFGLLSTHSRLHGSNSYRVPWNFGEESVEVLRYFTKLKASLMPYLYRNAVETSRTGIPMMRSMVLEYQDDPACGYLDRQYMLGDSLLVAPVFNEDGIASFYLPEGTWTNYLTGERKKGGRFVEEYHDYFSLPLYVKENSIIAVGSGEQGAEYDYADGVTFRAYALRDGLETSATVYNGKAEKEAEVRILRENNRITIRLDVAKPCKVMLAGEIAESVAGAVFVQEAEGVVVTPEAGVKEIVVMVK